MMGNKTNRPTSILGRTLHVQRQNIALNVGKHKASHLGIIGQTLLAQNRKLVKTVDLLMEILLDILG